jgi:hypothetical protein
MIILDRLYKFHKSENSQMDFQASNLDEASDPKYYGFVCADGAYFVMEKNDTAGTIKYCFGKNLANYDTDWTGRAALTYKRYDEIMGG